MKTNLSAEFGVAHHLGDLLQHQLSRLVMGMGLAGKEELHRTLGIVDHGRQSLDIGEDQVGSFVGGKAPSEADGQGIRREYFAQPMQGLVRFATTFGLFVGTAAHKVDELRFEAEVGFPEFAIVEILDGLPGASQELLPCQPTPR